MASGYFGSKHIFHFITKAPWQFISNACTLNTSPGTTFAPGRVKLSQDGPVERSLYPNLKLTMYRSGIRQNTLAKSIGMNEASLSRIINGTRQPAPEVRVQIATILHENVDWLFQQTHAGDDSEVLAGMIGMKER